MKVSNRKVQLTRGWVKSSIAGVLVLLMMTPSEVWAMTSQQSNDQQATGSAAATAELPDAPNAIRAATEVSALTQQSTPAEQPSQQPAQQASQQQNGGSQPVGTAAAPLPKSGGVAASRPAGAVIAPGKQRRARAIFIRVAVVVAAAVAVGTVVGLSKASPSRPN